MWGSQGVGWSHLRGPCRRRKPLPLARVEVEHYHNRDEDDENVDFQMTDDQSHQQFIIASL